MKDKEILDRLEEFIKNSQFGDVEGAVLNWIKEQRAVVQQEVKRTERGWPSHFCCSDRCVFHRSTLLEYNGIAIVVSSVGRLLSLKQDEFMQVGHDRYFETMVFYANDTEFQDADVSYGELYMDCPETNTSDDEIGANNKHEEVVDLFVGKLLNGEIIPKEKKEKEYED